MRSQFEFWVAARRELAQAVPELLIEGNRPVTHSSGMYVSVLVEREFAVLVPLFNHLYEVLDHVPAQLELRSFVHAVMGSELARASFAGNSVEYFELWRECNGPCRTSL